MTSKLEMKNFCYCFSLKTGSKVIGWQSLIESIFTLFMSIFIFFLPVDDLVTYIKHNIAPKNVEFVKEFILVSAAVLFVLSILFIAHAAILLVGVYQKKASLVKTWITISLTWFVMGFVSFVCQLFMCIINPSQFLVCAQIAPFLLMQLYCILVVRSYYEQMQSARGEEFYMPPPYEV